MKNKLSIYFGSRSVEAEVDSDIDTLFQKFNHAREHNLFFTLSAAKKTVGVPARDITHFIVEPIERKP